MNDKIPKRGGRRKGETFKISSGVVNQPAFDPRPELGPIPGKQYDLKGSPWIWVEGWRFKFGRPVIVGPTKKGNTWLGFSAYFESPRLAAPVGKKGRCFAMVIRSLRVFHGRLQPPMAPMGNVHFYNVCLLGYDVAMLMYHAAKQWSVIRDNPELTIDGTKNPIGSLAYSAKTARMALAPMVGLKKSSTKKLETHQKMLEGLVKEGYDLEDEGEYQQIAGLETPKKMTDYELCETHFEQGSVLIEGTEELDDSAAVEMEFAQGGGDEDEDESAE